MPADAALPAVYTPATVKPVQVAGAPSKVNTAGGAAGKTVTGIVQVLVIFVTLTAEISALCGVPVPVSVTNCFPGDVKVPLPVKAKPFVGTGDAAIT